RALPTRLQEGHADDGGRGDQRGQRNDGDNAPIPCCYERASFRRHAPSVATNGVATFPKAMPSYRELLQQVKSEIDEADVTQARELLAADGRPLVVDVRELDEWTEGRIPGAIR